MEKQYNLVRKTSSSRQGFSETAAEVTEKCPHESFNTPIVTNRLHMAQQFCAYPWGAPHWSKKAQSISAVKTTSVVFLRKRKALCFFFSSSHYCNKQLRNFYLFARWALRKFTFTDVKYIPIELYTIGQTKSSMTTSCVWIRQMVCVPQRASQTGGQSVNMGWIYSSLNNGAGEGFQQPPRQLVGLPDAVCCDQISQTLKL